jgi:hypothetical protein
MWRKSFWKKRASGWLLFGHLLFGWLLFRYRLMASHLPLNWSGSRIAQWNSTMKTVLLPLAADGTRSATMLKIN